MNPFCIPHSTFFFFNDTATTEIYTLSLHDALPICYYPQTNPNRGWRTITVKLKDPKWKKYRIRTRSGYRPIPDRKSTRLNSSHSQISYAVFCLKKKKN